MINKNKKIYRIRTIDPWMGDTLYWWKNVFKSKNGDDWDKIAAEHFAPELANFFDDTGIGGKSAANKLLDSLILDIQSNLNVITGFRIIINGFEMLSSLQQEAMIRATGSALNFYIANSGHEQIRDIAVSLAGISYTQSPDAATLNKFNTILGTEAVEIASATGLRKRVYVDEELVEFVATNFFTYPIDETKLGANFQLTDTNKIIYENKMPYDYLQRANVPDNLAGETKDMEVSFPTTESIFGNKNNQSDLNIQSTAVAKDHEIRITANSNKKTDGFELFDKPNETQTGTPDNQSEANIEKTQKDNERDTSITNLQNTINDLTQSVFIGLLKPEIPPLVPLEPIDTPIIPVESVPSEHPDILDVDIPNRTILVKKNGALSIIINSTYKNNSFGDNGKVIFKLWEAIGTTPDIGVDTKLQTFTFELEKNQSNSTPTIFNFQIEGLIDPNIRIFYITTAYDATSGLSSTIDLTQGSANVWLLGVEGGAGGASVSDQLFLKNSLTESLTGTEEFLNTASEGIVVAVKENIEKTKYINSSGINIDVPSSYTILVNSNNAIEFTNSQIDIFKTFETNNNKITGLLPATADGDAVEYSQINKTIFEGALTGTTPIIIPNANIKNGQKYTISVENTIANQDLEIFVNDFKFWRQDTSEFISTDAWRPVFALLSPEESVSFEFYKGFNNKIIINSIRDQIKIGDNVIVKETGFIDDGNNLQIRSNQVGSTDYIKIREV